MNKYTISEVQMAIEADGSISECVSNSIDAEEIKNKKLAALWREAEKILFDIEQFIEENSGEDDE